MPLPADYCDDNLEEGSWDIKIGDLAMPPKPRWDFCHKLTRRLQPRSVQIDAVEPFIGKIRVLAQVTLLDSATEASVTQQLTSGNEFLIETIELKFLSGKGDGLLTFVGCSDVDKQRAKACTSPISELANEISSNLLINLPQLEESITELYQNFCKRYDEVMACLLPVTQMPSCEIRSCGIHALEATCKQRATVGPQIGCILKVVTQNHSAFGCITELIVGKSDAGKDDDELNQGLTKLMACLDPFVAEQCGEMATDFLSSITQTISPPVAASCKRIEPAAVGVTRPLPTGAQGGISGRPEVGSALPLAHSAPVSGGKPTALRSHDNEASTASAGGKQISNNNGGQIIRGSSGGAATDHGQGKRNGASAVTAPAAVGKATADVTRPHIGAEGGEDDSEVATTTDASGNVAGNNKEKETTGGGASGSGAAGKVNGVGAVTVASVPKKATPSDGKQGGDAQRISNDGDNSVGITAGTDRKTAVSNGKVVPSGGGGGGVGAVSLGAEAVTVDGSSGVRSGSADTSAQPQPARKPEAEQEVTRPSGADLTKNPEQVIHAGASSGDGETNDKKMATLQSIFVATKEPIKAKKPATTRRPQSALWQNGLDSQSSIATASVLVLTVVTALLFMLSCS